jgi:hypothetical protein
MLAVDQPAVVALLVLAMSLALALARELVLVIVQAQGWDCASARQGVVELGNP